MAVTRIRILRTIVGETRTGSLRDTVGKGSVVDVTDTLATELIASNAAEPAPGAPLVNVPV